MELLKQKIFDVLNYKLEVFEFEKWLYESQIISENINSDDFVYDVVTINYKSIHWLSELKAVVFKKYDYEEYLISLIKYNCEHILKSKNSHESFMSINNIMRYFEFETDYDLLWDFYLFDCDYDLIEVGYWTEENYNSEAKKLAETILEKFKNCYSLDEEREVLKSRIDPFYSQHKAEHFPENDSKMTFIKKFLAFFKNI